MADNQPKDNRKDYILRRGIHDGVDRNGNRRLFHAGETVPLTENQASSFSDKFTEITVFQAEKELIRQQAISAARSQLEAAERAGEGGVADPTIPGDTTGLTPNVGAQNVHEPIQPGQNPPKVAADVPKTDENAMVTSGDKHDAVAPAAMKAGEDISGTSGTSSPSNPDKKPASQEPQVQPSKDTAVTRK